MVSPEDAISAPTIDIICIGEGEEPLRELCDVLERAGDLYHIQNLWNKLMRLEDSISMGPLISFHFLEEYCGTMLLSPGSVNNTHFSQCFPIRRSERRQ